MSGLPALTMRKIAVGLVCVVLVVTAAGWVLYHRAVSAITTSSALDGQPASPGGEQNILIMGLDTRRDQQGKPLPLQMYDALHAGDQSYSADGAGYDADVLLVAHVPAGDGPVTVLSIPRDDYVDLPGCPGGQCQGKVKTAYRLAYQDALSSARPSGGGSAWWTQPPNRAGEQEAREAGRRAQIAAVRALLDIPIDHFVEIGLAGFFEVARVVAPITVCLNGDTSDPSYSGAGFRRGLQQIDAAQALAFVRQRRDLDDQSFTDLDRTRRQQAFLVGLLGAVRREANSADPGQLRDLLGVARRNIAVDSGLDLAAMVDGAAELARHPVRLYTLPINDFRTLGDGEDVNIVDPAAIRGMVAGLLSGSAGTSARGWAAPAALHSAPVTTVPATGSADAGPAPTDLSRMTDGSVPCVK